MCIFTVSQLLYIKTVLCQHFEADWCPWVCLSKMLRCDCWKRRMIRYGSGSQPFLLRINTPPLPPPSSPYLFLITKTFAILCYYFWFPFNNFYTSQTSIPNKTTGAKGPHKNYYTALFRITKHTKIQMKNRNILYVWRLSDLKAAQRY